MNKTTNVEPVKPRYIMIGGFLGAGKTTSVLKLAQRLSASGSKVGLITNDQGHGLVDTAMLRSNGFDTEEIPGGCFCCRFNSLMEAATRLTESTRPDVFIAEPVGSCTDLVATVTYPLRRIYGANFSIAPLSVLVDPIRALRLFELEPGGKFSPKVAYIYRKQLEEADLIVVNKTDAVGQDRLERLRARLVAEYPQANLRCVSARTSAGLDEWFDEIAVTDQQARSSIAIDYDLYGEGEALLGWLNATVALESVAPLDGNEMVRKLAGGIQRELTEHGAEIAHLKMTLNPTDGLGGLAVINLVRNDFVPELSQHLAEPTGRAELVVNLRAEAAPEILHGALTVGLERLCAESQGLTGRIEHAEHFRPGKPQPTHRITSLPEPTV